MARKRSKGYLLHLSDLHFGGGEVGEGNWFGQLADDLNHEQRINTLDGVLISGDVGTFSEKGEYESAAEFFKELCDHFEVKEEQVVLVPGNHDLSWPLSQKAYHLKYRDDLDELPPDECYIEVSEDVFQVRDEGDYKQRFANFSALHQAVKGKPYPPDYEQQGMLHHFPRLDLLVLGLNSSWEIDKFHTARASIHPGAVGHALKQITKSETLKSCRHKFVLWHHPLNSEEEDYLKDHGFLERLAVNGFTVALHGHIHKSETWLFRYDRKPLGRRIEMVGAGTFGAPKRKWTDGYPLQYNLLELEGDTLTVHTRCRRKLNGAWKPDAIWTPGAGKDPLPRYTITLPDPGVDDQEYPPPAEDYTVPLEIPEAYRKWLAEHCKEMELTRMIGTAPVLRASLPEIFIPLHTGPAAEKPEEDEEAHKIRMTRGKHDRDLEELMAESAVLVIEGQAGSGKTTLIKHFAFMAVREKNWRNLGTCLPVLIFLKDLRTFKPGNGPGNEKIAWKLLAHYFDRTTNGLDTERVKRYLEAGQVIFLLDGLDEIAPALRAHLVQSFAALRRNNSGARLILSGRPHGVDGEVSRFFHKHKASIHPLTMEQIEAFIVKWFANVAEGATRGTRKTAREMIGEIKGHPTIDRLIDNPLILTAICLLYHDKKELPGQRAELYQKFIDNLLHRRFDEPERIKNFLMDLAHEMHIKLKSRGIGQLKALEVLGREYPLKEGERLRDYKMRLEGEFEEIEPSCALMKFEEGEYGFKHLTFQEFLTAIHLVAEEKKDYAEAIKTYWGNGWYDEMIELYIGYLSISNKGIANEIVREKLAGRDRMPYRRWMLAARALLDISLANREAPVVGLAREKLWEIIGSGDNLGLKAEAGEILGRLGDKRGLKAFVPVEAGNYALELGEVALRAFEIGKYPVTNDWFGEFVKGGGYRELKYWTEQGRRWLEREKVKYPRFWHEWKWNCPNSPVVGVSWYEVHAFTRWLTEVSDDGFSYFLPDEQQWEAAAAGMAGRKYPWGDGWKEDVCNVDDILEKTSPVGIFEKGNTPEGLSDFAGNVWEWTRSDYKLKKNREDFEIEGKDQYPVVRGGS